MNDSEYFTEDNRKYVDPNVSLNEQNKFVDNLRNIQTANTNQINRQTHALGSDLPSNLGGLSGSEGLFKARYQTPQTNAMVADLKATAQQEALNTALSNYSDMVNKKLKDRYKKYVYDNTNKPSTNPDNNGKDPTTYNNPDDKPVEVSSTIQSDPSGALNDEVYEQDGFRHVVKRDPVTGNIVSHNIYDGNGNRVNTSGQIIDESGKVIDKGNQNISGGGGGWGDEEVKALRVDNINNEKMPLIIIR